jgi:hypothetical protein
MAKRKMTMKYFTLLTVILLEIYSPGAHADEKVEAKRAQTTISGYLQARFQYTNKEGEVPNNTFNLCRGRLQLKSKLTSALSTTLEVDVVTNKVEAKDVYLEYEISKDFSVRIGQQKKPFSFTKLLPAHSLLIIERPRHIEQDFDGYSGRDVGLLILLPHSKTTKTLLGVFNGAGTSPESEVDNNNGKDFAGRIEIFPIGGLTIGGNASLRMLTGRDETEQKTVIAYGVDVYFSQSEFQFLAEGLFGDRQIFYSDSNMMGLHATAVYKLKVNTPGIIAVEPGGRIEFFDRDKSVPNDSVLSLTPYVGIYLHKHAQLQFNTCVSIPQEGDISIEFTAQAQMKY